MSITATNPTTMIEPVLFTKLARRVEVDHLVDRDLAVRVVDQALAFLGTCAVHTGRPLAPSDLVDLGWHAFILHTREYAEFCQRVAGRFIHHVPTDPDDPDSRGESARDHLRYTVEAMANAGYFVDEKLWSVAAWCKDDDGQGDGSGRCNQCHAKCVGSP